MLPITSSSTDIVTTTTVIKLNLKGNIVRKRRGVSGTAKHFIEVKYAHMFEFGWGLEVLVQNIFVKKENFDHNSVGILNLSEHR